MRKVRHAEGGSHPAKGLRRDLRRLAWVAVSFACFALGGFLWGAERWMRPAFASGWPGSVALLLWIPGAAALWFALAAPWNRRIARFSAWLAASVILMLGSERMAFMLSVQEMCSNPRITGVWDSEKSAMLRLMDGLKARGLPVPEAVRGFLAGRRQERVPRVEHLLEESRWPARRSFVKTLLRSPKGSIYLAKSWHTHFAAVIGADVTLRRRRELLDWLERCRTDQGTSPEAAETAAFWCGLIVLTDPEVFADRRKGARDWMLSVANPPVIEPGDCWMKALDLLMAFDPADENARLSARFARDPTLLRRAVRERVRGMERHFEAIRDEVNRAVSAADLPSAFALWVDAGRLFASHPPPPEAEAWRRAVFRDWILTCELDEVFLDQPDDSKVDYLVPPEAGFTYDPADSRELAEQIGGRLDTAGKAWLLQPDDLTSETDVRAVVRRMVWAFPFLQEPDRRVLARLAAPLLFEHGLIVMRTGAGRWDSSARLLPVGDLPEEMWPYLDASHLKGLDRVSRWLWDHRRRAYRPDWLVMDRWSDKPGLSEEEWLLAVAAMWESHPREFEFSEERPDSIRRDGRLVIPPIADDARERARDKFKEIIKFRSGAPLQPPSPIVLPDWMERALLRMYAMARSSRNHHRPDPGLVFEVRMLLLGLCPVSEELRVLLEESTDPPDSPYWNLSRMESRGLVPGRRKLSTEKSTAEVITAALDGGDLVSAGIPVALKHRDWTGPSFRWAWAGLRQAAREGPLARRQEAFGLLLALSNKVPAEERMGMRGEFRRFWRDHPPRRGEWPTDAMVFMDGSHRNTSSEGVGWEEDALAAELAWSSGIKRETNIYPVSVEDSNGAFPYLAQAMVSWYDEGFVYGLELNPLQQDEPAWKGVWKLAPPKPPFAPTPWQKARELHLKRPDFHWPECAPPRPRRE